MLVADAFYDAGYRLGYWVGDHPLVLLAALAVVAASLVAVGQARR